MSPGETRPNDSEMVESLGTSASCCVVDSLGDWTSYERAGSITLVFAVRRGRPALMRGRNKHLRWVFVHAWHSSPSESGLHLIFLLPSSDTSQCERGLMSRTSHGTLRYQESDSFHGGKVSRQTMRSEWLNRSSSKPGLPTGVGPGDL